ncbi:acetyl ornithine aminotransferase family protein [Candidatus Aminicenantes bacterium AC-335-B20]|jgi:4-aminobutyrate aminotransferase|nr:acetyl ornithine aminotransferase family protein [SCandidatus Aminicenantes bacterium Aminicenantia_JdfR_composite]MCP2597031.1 acetyl ornithine aminotransferase family protein [Candidatus Aminicenantes bacterium AC-335-G13]MCP2599204.1 acetyl ornithine aminotransferase family protein [Candidatus Aminicenantes bacterium AC-335-B20]MCP2618956.1 acetyl ornithine aminotransferase family protein [Candidatus Aminicenantes bacterium AC-335-A11]MCP2619356.1 acetyl ornithine aminotransferase family 
MKYPCIKTSLPGPKAKELLEKDKKFVSPSYTRPYPLTVKKAHGMLIEDMDGNIFLDFTAGIAVNVTGHTHPKVVEAIKKQSEELIHMSGTDFYYAPQVLLAEKLAEIVPIKGEKKVFFGNSGTEVVEAAIKLARYYTKRPGIIAFYGSFHGRTLGSLSLTASKAVQRKNMAPFLPNVFHSPYAYCYRCIFGKEVDNCKLECISFIKEFLFSKIAPPEDIAAIIIEPIQGEGGYNIPPEKFIKAINDLAKENKILLIVDEIQSGMGRTGKWFAFEHFGIEPDIVTIAKGIASGLPLGVCVSKAEIMTWEPGAHASTFGGNPVSCASALATIELLEKELISNAKEMGEYMLSKLRELQKKHPLIGDIRGKGLMIGVELVKDRETKEKAKEERDKIVYKCFEKGLIILGAGENSIRFCPPLIIKKEDIDIGLKIFEKALSDVEKEKGYK